MNIKLIYQHPPYHVIRATLHETSPNRADAWALDNEVLAEQLYAIDKDVYKIEDNSVFLGYAIYAKGTNNFLKMGKRLNVNITQSQLPQTV